MNKTLAQELYGINVREDYPCGCQFSINEAGETIHYVRPDCPFDGRKIGNSQIKGYHYVAWKD